MQSPFLYAEVINLTNYGTEMYPHSSNALVVPNGSSSYLNWLPGTKRILKNVPKTMVLKIFVDDAFSGVNFECPRFQEMIAMIETGKIDTLIIQNFSRFGRNYIEVGQCTKIILPRLGVRYIAINDNYNSLSMNFFILTSIILHEFFDSIIFPVSLDLCDAL